VLDGGLECVGHRAVAEALDVVSGLIPQPCGKGRVGGEPSDRRAQGARVAFGDDQAVALVLDEAARGGADRVGRHDGDAGVHRLVDDEAPGLSVQGRRDRGQHEASRAGQFLGQALLRQIADDLQPRVLRCASCHLAVERAVAHQAQPYGLVGQLGEGVEQVGEALALLELADEEHLGGAVANRLNCCEPLGLDRLPGHEDLARVDVRGVDEKALDVLAVGHDRLGGPVDVASERLRDAVKRGAGVVPHAGPQHERKSPRPAGTVDERKHQLAVERLHDRVVAAAVQPQGETGHDRLAGYAVTVQLHSVEVAGVDQRDPAVPVALALVGEEVEVHLHPARELLVEPPSVVRREVVDERDPASHDPEHSTARRLDSGVSVSTVCGIVGQASRDGRPGDRGTLERMCSALAHRGPDQRGLHVDDGIGLGIQRLRVIDLATGDQPIFNEDGSVAVVLNGEVYNYRELRAGLERSGHVFVTSSDTEVIAHLYEEDGPRLVHRLHGMFGLAVWDARRRRLLLARDRVGKKPLYYAEHGEGLTFASELAALLEDERIPRDVDHRALDAFLAYRWVPSPMTAFRAVRKLAPGTVLVFEDGRVRTSRYWQLDFSRKRRVDDPREVHEELREHIRAATARRLVADVPLGAFLSGGVDSAAVVAAMAEASPHPVRTFSIGFTSEKFNELPLARLVAERFATEHHELVVEPHALELIPRIVRHYGEPFADDSAIPSFYLADMARRHVTVALNGDGGDESFAGYPRYVVNLASARLERLPLALRRALSAVGLLVPESGTIDSWNSRIRRAAETVTLNGASRYVAYMTHLNGVRRERLYTDEYRELVGQSVASQVLERPWRDSGAASVVDVMLDVDIQTYLPDDLLVKMDIATMAASLEARSPLLDHELMQFAASLPAELKVRGREKKVVLRAALRGWIPDEILDAPKRGLRLPLGDWFRGELRDFTRDVLLDPRAIGRGWFREAYVRQLLDRHRDGVQDHSQGIWTLLMFELWHQEFVDRPQGDSPTSASSTAFIRSAERATS
jgi:asparagine synthase (glutamine-hydrolysing)